MLKTILSVTGKPGLFRLLSQGKGTIIVEELGTGKRMPVHARDKVVSLGDIAMYTESGDTPLGEILDKVYAKFEGKPADIKEIEAAKSWKDVFGSVVEDFDRERVHDSDIKKLLKWYNLLLSNGFRKFSEEKEEGATAESAEKTEE